MFILCQIVLGLGNASKRRGGGGGGGGESQSFAIGAPNSNTECWGVKTFACMRARE